MVNQMIRSPVDQDTLEGCRCHRKKDSIDELHDEYFDLSGTLGIGYSFGKYFSAEFRYNHSFTHYQKIPISIPYGEVVGELIRYNQFVQLLLFLKLE